MHSTAWSCEESGSVGGGGGRRGCPHPQCSDSVPHPSAPRGGLERVRGLLTTPAPLLPLPATFCLADTSAAISPSPSQIVTGRGNRSDVRHRSQLREAVMKLLQPLVPVRLAPGNDGLLLVYSSQMLRLLRFMTRRGHSFDPVSMKGFLVEPGGGQEGDRGVKMNHSSRCC